jgi:hypothetical protein
MDELSLVAAKVVSLSLVAVKVDLSLVVVKVVSLSWVNGEGGFLSLVWW